MIVKIAATQAGIVAMEEATYRGISINATVSFTLPQAIAVAEAVERGLKRREAEGLDITTMGPVCTIMVGRLDDWLKVVMEKRETIGRSRLSGVGRRSGLQEGLQDYTASADTGCGFFPRHFAITCTGANSLAAMSSSLPRAPGSCRFNASDVEVIPRMDLPVDPKIVDTLLKKFPT